jgi:hypothetical protein
MQDPSFFPRLVASINVQIDSIYVVVRRKDTKQVKNTYYIQDDTRQGKNKKKK